MQLTRSELSEDVVVTATLKLQKVFSYDSIPLPVVDEQTLAIQWTKEGVSINLQEQLLAPDFFNENQISSQHSGAEYPVPQKMDDVPGILTSVFPTRVYVVTCID